jgi:hypothetical protein
VIGVMSAGIGLISCVATGGGAPPTTCGHGRRTSADGGPSAIVTWGAFPAHRA